MRLAPPPLLASDYDAFLFASIGEEGNGMPLSVLSALARQDVDPWQEAAQLARLPGLQATRRLSLRIEALPGRSSEIVDPATLAARLLTLLPGVATIAKPKRPASNVWIALYVTVMAFIMCAEYVLADHGAPADGSAARPSPPVSDRSSTDETP
jgi:hypothetical protein